MFEKDYRLKKMLLPNKLWKRAIKEEQDLHKRKENKKTIRDQKKLNLHSRDQVSFMESNFSHLTYIAENQWDDELDRVYHHGKDLSDNWYHLLDKLSVSLDKLTSPFQNTDRASLHKTQKFIEHILNDRKTYGHEKTYLEKLKTAIDKYSESIELRDCAQQIYYLERDLNTYRQTLDLQLTFLWNTKQKDQSVDLCKKYINQYHTSIKQMETRFITLLEKSTPNPDEYTCSICFSVFTNPVTIHPCLHTFCKGCLQKLYCQCTIKDCKSSCHDTSTLSKKLSIIENDHDYIQVPNYTANIDPSRRPSTASSLLMSSSPLVLDNNNNNNSNNNITNTSNINNHHHQNKENHPHPHPSTSTSSQSPSLQRRRLSFMPPFKTNYSETNLLKCDCLSHWQPPTHCKCPRCQFSFGSEDCTFATGLDNLIRLYFPRQDHLYHKYEVRQKQLKRKSILNTLSFKLIPSSSTPHPRQHHRSQQHPFVPSSSSCQPSVLSSLSSSTKDFSFRS
ncbi:unnamed protein product [Cunninghamella blakesleeana]